jgi:uncharacterized LabA/DUF88 family protein
MASPLIDTVGFMDVGYLTAEGARALDVPRRAVSPNAAGCVKWMRRRAANRNPPARFLRLYWYDGAFEPRDKRHHSQRRYFDGIAATPGVQLRLGHLQVIRPRWQHALERALEACGVDRAEFAEHFRIKPEIRQKGVDTRLTLDLVRLAQKHVYDTAVLIAGDRDLAEPVRVAQDEGSRVVLVTPEGAGVAKELHQLADLHQSIGPEELRELLDVDEEKVEELAARSAQEGTQAESTEESPVTDGKDSAK